MPTTAALDVISKPSQLRDFLGGDAGDLLLASNMDHHVLKPWIDSKGRSCRFLLNGYDAKGKPQYRVIAANSPSTLMKDQWIQMDETVLRVARPELRVWGDIVGAGLTYNIPNGMAVTILQHQTMTDAGEATLSMDGLRRTNRDRPLFDIGGLPLPIVHSDFSFSLREILTSRGQRLPLDLTMVEQATRKCVEQIEKLTLGLLGTYSYGGATIYGLTNMPQRLVQVLTAPTTPGWVPEDLVTEVLAMIQQLSDQYYNGPYGVWYSPAFTQYMENNFSAVYNGKTLRQRLMDIGDIRFWKKADYLTGFQILIVDMRSTVVQAVTGMKLQTIQWSSGDGLEKHFKVMGIMVPRLRADSNGDTGIAHGAAA